jgi:hypothetical protein
MLIGTRTLFVETADGEKKVPVAVFAPEATETTLWRCRYEIGWPEGAAMSEVLGNDALHALNMAQQKIATDLYMSRYHHERKMSWIKPWVGYGFPMPKGARDLLIGSDKEYYG